MQAGAETARAPERCTWCGIRVDPDDGYRLGEPAGERRAVFCRLEHVVPWVLQGAHWEPGAIGDPGGLAATLTACACCGEAVPDTYLLLVRHRGEHRIPDAFCSADHLAEWAKAGGRWRA
jgi:hypothetical protein